MKKSNGHLERLAVSGMLLAAALLLPLLTGQLQQIGNMLCPMHIPVLLCGFLCGWQWGMAVGFAAPLLRFVIFGMPPLMPLGIAMAFELAAYGLVAGLLCGLLPKKNGYLYVELVAAMLAGRLVWGAVRYILSGIQGTPFGLEAFWAGAITNAVPGIVLQLLVLPPLVMALRRAGLAPGHEKSEK